MEAGPSRPKKAQAARKPRGTQPSATTKTRKKLAPPLPAPPLVPSGPSNGATPPIKTLQGVSMKRTDARRPEYGREVVFVTRKSSLGMLLGRCKSLVMNEGYTRLTLHAMSAAIPQAILLLHALLDVLPYPRGKKGMWYEMRTGSVECVDEVGTVAGAKRQVGNMDVDLPDVPGDSGELDKLLEGIGNVESEATTRISRVTSTIEIVLHIGAADTALKIKRAAPGEGKARPNKRKRQALVLAQKDEEALNATSGGRKIIDVEDEEMLISGVPSAPYEAEEEIEER